MKQSRKNIDKIPVLNKIRNTIERLVGLREHNISGG
jgi:hypothetical protein